MKTVQPQTDDSDENWEKYKERSELFTPGANFSTVYADEEIDLPFAKRHVARITGYPAPLETHRRAGEWPARKRARLKRQMKVSIGANGGSASRLGLSTPTQVITGCPSTMRRLVGPLHVRHLPLDPYLVSLKPG